ncbi:transcriptional regulator protein YdcR [Escherichia coli]|uniref:Transcriptional regulator protein YdcR n=1 Tax=Escherichia coli TaxID=562 RepID=A0A484X7F2_ECOLX|nr:transcriptional regulator protein YdcR [Escherichia coli]
MTFIANFILDGKNRCLRKRGDRHDGVLHCSSFSKCLVPGFRIGWVAAGKHARKIQRLQLMSTLSTSSPMQLALVDYLSTRRYDAHLRRLRRQLAERKQRAWQALLRYLPAEVKIHHNDSGYFLWLELPEPLDAGELSLVALTHHISIARVICFLPVKTGHVFSF